MSLVIYKQNTHYMIRLRNEWFDIKMNTRDS